MSGQKIHVLHVDDEPSFGELTVAMLSSHDDRFEVESVTDAETGMERLAESSFDCVVSDYDMPGTDGIEFLRWVRSEHGSLPFVLFTGQGSEMVASEAISAGVTEYLQKRTGTGQFAVLANRVANVVDRRRAREQRDRLQHELRTEREHFWMALEHTPVVAFRLDTDLRYTWVGNPHPGFDAEGVLGKRDDELLDPEAAETVMAPKREALETGERVRRRVSYDLPSGPVTYDLTVEPLRGEDGEVVGLSGAAIDVTGDDPPRSVLEAALEGVETGLVVLSVSTDVAYLNGAAAELLGLDAAAAVGRPLCDLVGAFEPHHETLSATARDGTEASFVVSLPDAGEVAVHAGPVGSGEWLTLSLTPVAEPGSGPDVG